MTVCVSQGVRFNFKEGFGNWNEQCRGSKTEVHGNVEENHVYKNGVFACGLGEG